MRSWYVVWGCLALGPEPAWANTVSLTLPEAVELAVRNTFAVQQARLDEQDAAAQVDDAFSSVLPRLTGQARYTRTIEAADAFAGSQAGNSFGSLAALDWLQFNEQARTDQDAATNPISLSDFLAQQSAALEQAGLSVDPDQNPFLVENQLSFGLSLTQVIYDGSAFAALEASRVFEEATEQQTKNQIRNAVNAVSQAFYSAILAEERVSVLGQSVERAKKNLEETKVRVEQGVLPQLQQLTAEVELANRQTTLIRARNTADTSVDEVRRLIGLSGAQSLKLKGALIYSARAFPSSEAAVAEALEQRPDLKSAELNQKIQLVGVKTQKAQLLPVVNFVANLSANGAIPDDRQRAVASDPADPFLLESTELGLFDDSFWFPVFNLGIELEWTLFDGLGNYARIRRQRVALEKARVSVEELRLNIQLEVEDALRSLSSAQEQVETQERVRKLAEENYEQTEIRVQEGAGSHFELRQASEQLDESRFNYLQAIHDYLIAEVSYQVSVGRPPAVSLPKEG